MANRYQCPICGTPLSGTILSRLQHICPEPPEEDVIDMLPLTKKESNKKKLQPKAEAKEKTQCEYCCRKYVNIVKHQKTCPVKAMLEKVTSPSQLSKSSKKFPKPKPKPKPEPKPESSEEEEDEEDDL
jgi:hypothetical protein